MLDRSVTSEALPVRILPGPIKRSVLKCFQIFETIATVRFYTDEGNWDIVGNDIPVFFIQEGRLLSP
jgi:hypothetical protein